MLIDWFDTTSGPDLLGHVVSMVATGKPCHAFDVGVLNITTSSDSLQRLLSSAGTIGEHAFGPHQQRIASVLHMDLLVDRAAA